MRKALIPVLAAAVLLSACVRSPASHVLKGDELLNKGKSYEASVEYRRALQLEPNQPAVVEKLARIALQDGRTREAYGLYRQAAKLDPKRASAITAAADILLESYISDPSTRDKTGPELRELGSLLLNQDQGSFDGHRLLGSMDLAAGDIQGAVEHLARAQQVKPLAPDTTLLHVQALWAAKETAEAERLAASLIAKHPDFKPAYSVLARRLESVKRFADAESILRRKTETFPSDAESKIQLAALYGRQHKSAQMEAILHEVMNNPAGYADGWFQLGEFRSRNLQFETAATNYQSCISANSPVKSRCRERLAAAYIALRRPPEALAQVDALLKDEPKNTNASLLRAELLMQTGRAEDNNKLISELQKQLENAPNVTAARFSLGRAYLNKGDREAARGQFMMAARSRPDHVPSRALLIDMARTDGRAEQALRYADEILLVQPDFVPARIARVYGLTAAGRVGEAKPEMAELLKQFPNVPDVQQQAGYLALAEKDYRRAETIFLSLQKNRDPRGASGLADTYAAQNQFDRALAVLDEQLKIAPDPRVRGEKGRLAFRAGKPDLALAEFEALEKAGVDSLDLHLNLAELYARKGDTARALAEIGVASKLSPGDPHTHMIAGTIQELAGRPAEAIKEYREALRSEPRNMTAQNNIAYLLADTGGDLDEAARLATAATSAQPQNPVFLDTFGWVAFRRGDLNSARRALDRSAKLAPGTPSIHLHLAEVLIAQGDKASARRELEAALAANPGPADATQIKQKLRSL